MPILCQNLVEHLVAFGPAHGGTSRGFALNNTNTTEVIAWCSDFDTGIAEIDLQHRMLIDTFNRATAELRDDSGLGTWEYVAHEFLGYAVYHFSTEERLAAAHGYDVEESAEALAHYEEHRSVLAQLGQVRARFRSEGCASKAEFISFLRSWLLKHILQSDQRLTAFIRAKQLSRC